MPESLFETVDDGLMMPTESARGPWSPEALHGGPVAALLAGRAEAAGHAAVAGAGTDVRPARFTVELLRPVPLAPLRVDAQVARAGRKVLWIDAELRSAAGDRLAVARLLLMRTAPVVVPSQPFLTPPPPPADGERPTGTLTGFEYAAFHNEGVEHRFVGGQLDRVGPGIDWIRLRVPVVKGRDPTPLQRVAAAADFGNGVSASAHFQELRFMNADLTIYLHTAPVGEWICLDAVTRLGRDGIAVAESTLYDERGAIGRSLQSLLLDR